MDTRTLDRRGTRPNAWGAGGGCAAPPRVLVGVRFLHYAPPCPHGCCSMSREALSLRRDDGASTRKAARPDPSIWSRAGRLPGVPLAADPAPEVVRRSGRTAAGGELVPCAPRSLLPAVARGVEHDPSW